MVFRSISFISSWQMLVVYLVSARPSPSISSPSCHYTLCTSNTDPVVNSPIKLERNGTVEALGKKLIRSEPGHGKLGVMHSKHAVTSPCRPLTLLYAMYLWHPKSIRQMLPFNLGCLSSNIPTFRSCILGFNFLSQLFFFVQCAIHFSLLFFSLS